MIMGNKADAMKKQMENDDDDDNNEDMKLKQTLLNDFNTQKDVVMYLFNF